MLILIVGGGRTGMELAKQLIAAGHEVVVIEEDKDRAQKVSENLDCLVIQGDGTKMEILEKAEVEDVDCLVALTPNDESNLIICKLAKNLDIPRIVTRVNNGRNKGMFLDVGADTEINMVSATIGLFQKAITGPELYGIVSMGGDVADVSETQVEGGSKAEGRKIEDLDLPELVNISIITRDGELVPARGDTVIQEGDKVILAGDPELVSENAGEYFLGE